MDNLNWQDWTVFFIVAVCVLRIIIGFVRSAKKIKKGGSVCPNCPHASTCHCGKEGATKDAFSSCDCTNEKKHEKKS